MNGLLSVVIPCRNEADNLPILLSRLHAALVDELFEIVVVDDGSADSTLALLREAARSDPRVRYVALSRGFGKESALLAGLREARGDVIVIMDGDLQHPPEVVPSLVDLLRTSGCDQVVGVRDRSGETRFRRFV